MSYDQRSLELAEYFLMDEPKPLCDRAAALAQVIQDAVEDWIDAEREELEEPPETA